MQEDERRRRGLQSGIDIEEGLRNFWYPAAFSKVWGQCMLQHVTPPNIDDYFSSQFSG